MDKWESIQEYVKDQYTYLDETEEDIDEIEVLLKEKWEDVSD